MASKMTVRKLISLLVAVVLAMPLVTTPCASATADAAFNTVTDVIVGRNNKGPYPLSWTNIDTESMTVIINGRSLKNGHDYRVDTGKGMLSFDSVLVKDAIVRVTYRTIPGKSQKATGQVSIPVTLNLFQRQDANFHVTGLYAQDDPKNPDAGKTVVGVGGEKKWAGSSANSLFLISQRSDDRGGDQGSMWDRAGVKFGGDTSIGGIKLTGSYLHSGSEFAGGKEYSLGVGKQATDLAAAYALGSRLQMNAKFSDSEDTAGKTKGNRSTVNEQSLVYAPLSSTKISLMHSQKESATAAAGSERSVDSSSVRVDQAIGTRTSAIATFEDASITTGATEDKVQMRTVSLASNPLSNLSLRGGLTQKFSELHGKEQGMNFGVTSSPTQQVKVDVDVGTLENETVGHQMSTAVKVTTSPIPQLAIQAGYAGTDSSKLGDSTKTNLSFQAKPLDNIQLQGTLVGSAQNENEQSQRNFTLSATPARYAKLSALFSQSGINSLDDVTKGATVDLTPLANTQMSAGYRYVEAGPTVMTIRDYSATTQPLSFFRLSGSFRDRGLAQDVAPDTAAFDVSLAPVRYFTLTGNYQSNPEDKKGAVQNYRSRTVGLRTNVGSVGITTGYTARDEYLANQLTDETNVGLELPMFGHGLLTTGYKVGRMLNGSELSSQTYSLGYQHAVGSDFSLTLRGYYTRWLQDQMMLPEKTQYSAEASLGVKF